MCLIHVTSTRLQVEKVKSVSHSVVFNSLWPHGMQPTRLLCPWNYPGENGGVCCHSLLQRIFLTQGLNPGLLHCRQILYRVSQQGRLQVIWGQQPCFLLSGTHYWLRAQTLEPYHSGSNPSSIISSVTLTKIFTFPLSQISHLQSKHNSI